MAYSNKEDENMTIFETATFGELTQDDLIQKENILVILGGVSRSAEKVLIFDSMTINSFIKQKSREFVPAEYCRGYFNRFPSKKNPCFKDSIVLFKKDTDQEPLKGNVNNLVEFHIDSVPRDIEMEIYFYNEMGGVSLLAFNTSDLEQIGISGGEFCLKLKDIGFNLVNLYNVDLYLMMRSYIANT